jgi:hypothetical protein
MMDSANLQDDLKKLKGQFTASDVNKKELMYTVILLTNQRCDGFFEALDRLRTNTEFAQGRVAALQTAVPALLEAANKSSAVSNVAAALGFVSGTLSDVKQNYLFAEFRQQLYTKWQVSRAIQRKAMETVVTSATTAAEVRLYLYEYVRMCLPSQLKQWMYESAQVGVPSLVIPRLEKATPEQAKEEPKPPSEVSGDKPGPIVMTN